MRRGAPQEKPLCRDLSTKLGFAPLIAVAQGSAMSDTTIILGSKAYSSWSLRPWLALRRTGRPFQEVVIPLRTPETKGLILAHSPAGKVPVLKADGLVIWDSLAICEYLAERHPEAELWPADPAARALARSVVAEMHSGFQDLRSNLFMDLKRRRDHPERVEKATADIRRIEAIWADCRARHGAGGPYLFGAFSIADCFYAPVCTRFDTWGVALSATAQAYVDTMLAHPDMRDWAEAGRREIWEIDFGI